LLATREPQSTEIKCLRSVKGCTRLGRVSTKIIIKAFGIRPNEGTQEHSKMKQEEIILAVQARGNRKGRKLNPE
jgi:hypothetical protein